MGEGASTEPRTALVDVVSALCHLSGIGTGPNLGLLADGGKALGEDDELVAWDAVFLDSLGNNLLRLAIRVDIGGIPLISVRNCALKRAIKRANRIQTTIPRCLEQR